MDKWIYRGHERDRKDFEEAGLEVRALEAIDWERWGLIFLGLFEPTNSEMKKNLSAVKWSEPLIDLRFVKNS